MTLAQLQIPQYLYSLPAFATASPSKFDMTRSKPASGRYDLPVEHGRHCDDDGHDLKPMVNASLLHDGIGCKFRITILRYGDGNLRFAPHFMRTFCLPRKKKAMLFEHGCDGLIVALHAGQKSPSQAATGFLFGAPFSCSESSISTHS
jgi:hypothetical protein